MLQFIKNILSILLATLTTLNVYGFERQMHYEIKDFNNNGWIDTLECLYASGSGFGGAKCILINGKTNEQYEMDASSCWCDIKIAIPLHPGLRKPENAAFRIAMENILLPEKRNTPDLSLQWIFNATYSNETLSNNKYFDYVLNPQSNWTKGEIELPGSYYIPIESDTFNKLYPICFDKSSWLKANDKENKGYLVYYGRSHYHYIYLPNSRIKDSLSLIDSSQHYSVYRTFHGIVIKKEDAFKWVFVSDCPITGCTRKVMWESIVSVKLIDDAYLVIQQNVGLTEYHFYILNIETGKTGRLRCDLFEQYQNANYTYFSINDDKMLIRFGVNQPKEIEFTLTELFKELDAVK